MRDHMPDVKQKGWTITESSRWVTNGIHIGHAISTFETKGSFHTTNKKDCIRLHFGLRGDYSFIFKQINQAFDLIGGHHNLLYSNTLDLEIRNKSKVVETFGIEIPVPLFLEWDLEGNETFTEHVKIKRASIYSQSWGTVTISIQNIIDEILWNPYKGQLSEMFLLSKVLELIVLCIDQYRKKKKVTSVLRNRIERAKIVAARDYINANITNPPSLSEVAIEVGLNEFKLKCGFKEMFDNTPFGYLTERRLNLARQFLRDTEKKASEIAYELGYSSPQHFHHQFKKAFGVTPNYIRNNP